MDQPAIDHVKLAELSELLRTTVDTRPIDEQLAHHQRMTARIKEDRVNE